MSRAATDWAWSLNLKASQKLLLLSLADRADEYHCCYPSILRLVNDTGLDRKTIGKWINQMIEEGLLSDTGERKGPTKRVRVLKLNLDFKCTQRREDSSKVNGPKNGNVPKIGPISVKPLNDPKNGLLNDPKFGILNDPKNGTQNQSLEPNIEPINKTPPARATCEGEWLPSRYAFEGKVVKLNHADFASWQKLYAHLDLVYELQKLDIEFSYQKPTHWFITASQKLSYQNKQAVLRGQKAPAGKGMPHWNDRSEWENNFL
ncbi:helix-turn-helix domain-containing protein [Pantoea vagans]|uniref:helix-turn-helix domain-containing protein n=1 Tax=Pantoea vagans TaxID=470934 RepID=UPI0028E5505A|nr:helix-turn-helix domain-containing protein [Pantoea vagans]